MSGTNFLADSNHDAVLHYDSIAQNLSYLKINCDTFFDDQPGITAGLRRRMGKQSKLIENTINAIRELSYGLHSPSLDLLGIAQSIYQLCEEFSDLNGYCNDNKKMRK